MNKASKDVVILCGGTRDIAKNEANIGLRHVSQFVKCTANTNVIVTNAPARYDLHPSSCVNKEVESFNRKLQKSMKIHYHIRVCSMSTNRDHFTTHGLHMNAQGKNWITHTWASLIKTLTFSSLLSPIPLPEKNKCNEDPAFSAINSCVNNLEVTTTTHPPPIPLPRKEVPPVITPASSVSQCAIAATRTSGRTRKQPTTRGDDFLWTECLPSKV